MLCMLLTDREQSVWRIDCAVLGLSDGFGSRGISAARGAGDAGGGRHQGRGATDRGPQGPGARNRHDRVLHRY